MRLDVALDLKGEGLSGTATIKVRSRSARAEQSPLLVCAVLREDGVVTAIPSGENKGRSLVARFPARQTKYEFIELDGKSPTTQRFRSRSSQPGSVRTSGWPCSFRTSAQASFTRRPTSRGDRLRPPRRPPLRQPRRRPGCVEIPAHASQGPLICHDIVSRARSSYSA